jgi:hypothetical protein
MEPYDRHEAMTLAGFIVAQQAARAGRDPTARRSGNPLAGAEGTHELRGALWLLFGGTRSAMV